MARAHRLRYYGASILRSPCREVDPDEPGLGDLVSDMRRVMRRHDGVGLAAPQVGRDLRLVLVWPPERREESPTVMLNPVIETVSEDDVPFLEGCLSFPGIYRTVDRPGSVEVSYQQPGGRRVRRRCDGLEARIVLHEVDHLDGKLLVDHLSGWRRRDVQLRMIWRRIFPW